MSRTRFVPALIAACFVASFACSDTVAPTRSPPAAAPAQPTLVALSGVIHLNGEDRDGGVVLNTTDGDAIRLAGSETALLARLENAEVDVRGVWIEDGALDVNDFLVRRVDGREAMDGVLTALWDDDDTIIGYGLALTRSASVLPLIDPPDELIAHVGERVWVTGAADGPPTAFGIIGK